MTKIDTGPRLTSVTVATTDRRDPGNMTDSIEQGMMVDVTIGIGMVAASVTIITTTSVPTSIRTSITKSTTTDIDMPIGVIQTGTTIAAAIATTATEPITEKQIFYRLRLSPRPDAGVRWYVSPDFCGCPLPFEQPA